MEKFHSYHSKEKKEHAQNLIEAFLVKKIQANLHIYFEECLKFDHDFYELYYIIFDTENVGGDTFYYVEHNGQGSYYLSSTTFDEEDSGCILYSKKRDQYISKKTRIHKLL